jgi:F-box and leucine-rich repeat protein GRR1
MNTADDTEYDDDDDNHRTEVHDPDIETGEDDDEYLSRRVYFGANARGYRLPRPPRGPPRQPLIRRDHQERTVIIPQQPNGTTLEPPTIVETDGDSDRMEVATTPVAPPRKFRGFGQSAVVETSASPPPSDAASVRSTGTNQSNGGTFFRTHQEIASSSHSNGALTPDLNYAEIGHGRGTERTPQAGPSSSPPPSLKRVAEPMSHLDAQSTFNIPRAIDGQPEMLDDQAYGFGGPVFSPPFVVQQEETPEPTPMNVDQEEPAQSSSAVFPPEAGKVAKRGLRNPFTFASSPFSYARFPNGHDPGKSNGHGTDAGSRKH